MKYADRITFNLNQCGGRPCIRSMRLRVTDAMEMMAVGVSETKILMDFPYLKADDTRACLECAAFEADHSIEVR